MKEWPRSGARASCAGGGGVGGTRIALFWVFQLVCFPVDGDGGQRRAMAVARGHGGCTIALAPSPWSDGLSKFAPSISNRA